MKKLLVSTIALAFVSGAAMAQTSTGQPATTAPGTSSSGTAITTTTFTPAQETAVKTFVMKEKTAPITLPSSVTLKEGVVLPQDVTLSKFDSSVSGVTQYNYVVVEGRTAVVEPSSRKVIKIIEK